MLTPPDRFLFQLSLPDSWRNTHSTAKELLPIVIGGKCLAGQDSHRICHCQLRQKQGGGSGATHVVPCIPEWCKVWSVYIQI